MNDEKKRKIVVTFPPYDCQECNQQVVFDVALIRWSNDEREYLETFLKIDGCVSKAKCPIFCGHLKSQEQDWKKCPFYIEHSKERLLP